MSGNHFIPNAVRFTKEGGIAIRYIAGETLVKGNAVKLASTGKVTKITVDIPDPIGIVYEDAAADAFVWVVVSGKAEALFVGNTTAGHLARGFLTADGGSYIAGYLLSEAVPTSPFASDKHFYELGHVAQSRTGAGLALINMHFN